MLDANCTPLVSRHHELPLPRDRQEIRAISVGGNVDTTENAREKKSPNIFDVFLFSSLSYNGDGVDGAEMAS